MSTLGGQNFRKQGIFRENFLAAPSAPLKFALFIIFFADMGGGQNPILPPLDSALGALAPPCPTEKRVWGGGANCPSTMEMVEAFPQFSHFTIETVWAPKCRN